MQPIISAIIPVYNKEKYLVRCLDSVVEQTIFTQLEVFVIDDGSTDNSFIIMQEYQQKHSNINIFRQNNAGVSATRNKGIKLALGKYICFIDADDFIDSGMMETLYRKANQDNSEITVCNVNIYNSVTNKISHIKSIFEGNILFEKKESMKLLTDTTIGWSTCNKLYCLEFIRENGILFEEFISYGEDFLFNFYAFLKVKKVAFLDKYLYYYVRMTETSLSVKPNAKSIEQGNWVFNQFRTLSDNVFHDMLEEKSIIEVLIILNILAGYYSCVINGLKLEWNVDCYIRTLIKDYFGNSQLLLSSKMRARDKVKILSHRLGLYIFAYRSYCFFTKLNIVKIKKL